MPYRTLPSRGVWMLWSSAVSGYESRFFFQAEDGIRDYKVTGVQTCALPIYATVRIVNVKTGESRETHTNKNGCFDFDKVIPGTYTVSVQQQHSSDVFVLEGRDRKSVV